MSLVNFNRVELKQSFVHEKTIVFWKRDCARANSEFKWKYEAVTNYEYCGSRSFRLVVAKKKAKWKVSKHSGNVWTVSCWSAQMLGSIDADLTDRRADPQHQPQKPRLHPARGPASLPVRTAQDSVLISGLKRVFSREVISFDQIRGDYFRGGSED